MALIAFVGDCHYQFHNMFEFFVAWQNRTGHKIDAIVHVGDFGVDQFNPNWAYYWREQHPAPIPTYVCLGNHEDYRAVSQWMVEPERIPNLHLLPDGEVTDVAGLKIACVWGNYSPKSWLHPERLELVRKQAPESFKAMHIYRPSVEKLLAYPGLVDVLITHDCSTAIVPRGFGGRPVPKGLMAVMGLDKDETAPPGCPGFTQLLDKFQPQYHFYGHFHVREDRELGPTKIICLNAFDQCKYNLSLAIEIVDFQNE